MSLWQLAIQPTVALYASALSGGALTTSLFVRPYQLIVIYLSLCIRVLSPLPQTESVWTPVISVTDEGC